MNTDIDLYAVRKPEARLGTAVAGRYRLETVQGTGGFSVIYKAQDLETGGPVAIKEFAPYQMDAADAQQRMLGLTQMRREADILARVQDLPGIPGVLDSFTHDGTYYVVKEYLDGMTCEEHARRFRGKIPYALVGYILSETASILDAVHQRGILHGDVSPMNIFLCADGRVCLIDWGNADELTVPDATGRFLQTASGLPEAVNQEFAAPEQLVASVPQDSRTDLYCLAAAGYRSLTGQFPRSAAERLHGQPLVPPSAVVAGLPAFFNDLLLRGLSIAKPDRFQSGAEMREEIARHMSFSVTGTGAGLAAVSAKLLQEKRSPLGVLISRLRR